MIELGLWFRGLRKLKHVISALLDNELGQWPPTGWPEGAGNDCGRLLKEFRDEDPENFVFVMKPYAPQGSKSRVM